MEPIEKILRDMQVLAWVIGIISYLLGFTIGFVCGRHKPRR